jgi:hypothetical protein
MNQALIIEVTEARHTVMICTQGEVAHAALPFNGLVLPQEFHYFAWCHCCFRSALLFFA